MCGASAADSASSARLRIQWSAERPLGLGPPTSQAARGPRENIVASADSAIMPSALIAGPPRRSRTQGDQVGDREHAFSHGRPQQRVRDAARRRVPVADADDHDAGERRRRSSERDPQHVASCGPACVKPCHAAQACGQLECVEGCGQPAEPHRPDPSDAPDGHADFGAKACLSHDRVTQLVPGASPEDQRARGRPRSRSAPAMAS